MKISVIIPTLNEEKTVSKTLNAVSRLINVDEIVVVDGGSTDSTCRVVESYAETKPLKLIKTDLKNRASQMNEGAKYAAHEIFWFIHADTRPIQGSGKQIKFYARYDEIVGGNFATTFEGANRWAKFLTWFYSQFHAATLLYGDSAIFVRRDVFEKLKGFRRLNIFEDVDFYRRLEKQGRCVYVDLPVSVMAERFENRSFFGTFLKWTILQFFYWLGVPPRYLAKTISANSMTVKEK